MYWKCSVVFHAQHSELQLHCNGLQFKLCQLLPTPSQDGHDILHLHCMPVNHLFTRVVVPLGSGTKTSMSHRQVHLACRRAVSVLYSHVPFPRVWERVLLDPPSQQLLSPVLQLSNLPLH